MSSTEQHTGGDADDQGPDAVASRRVDSAALVAGIVFLGMAVAFAFADLDSLEDQVRYVWPTALLAIGVGLLLGARRR